MAEFLGDFAAGASLQIWWNTNAIAGESITRATDGSIRIYKDNSDTQRTSPSGITDSEDVDGLTGVHRLHIDLSDNADAGFYAAGSNYAVVLVAATIDGKTINHALAQFSIANRPAQSLAASVITAIQSGLMLTTSYTAPDNATIANIAGFLDTEITTIINRIGAFTGSGVNTLLGFLRAVMRSDATLPTDVGGTYDPATDSLEVASAGGGLTAEEHAKVMLLGSGVVTYVSIVDVLTGNATVVKGDDYTSATGRQLSWLIEGYPTFTAMRFKLKRKGIGGLALDIAAASITPEGTGQRIIVSLTAAQTGLFAVGEKLYTFDLEGVIAGGNIMTPLVDAKLIVVADTR